VIPFELNETVRNLALDLDQVNGRELGKVTSERNQEAVTIVPFYGHWTDHV
jgi:hypothetical protein